MSKTSILLTGGSGLLGQHLTLDCDRPNRTQLNIVKPFFAKQYDMVIHAAAYTNVEEAEIKRQECFEANVWGTLNMLEHYPTTPFVYISSEYAHKPVNFYSLTKSLAEQLVMTHPNYLIIRTLFKPRPWKYPKAFVDQWTLGDYVDVIAPKIEQEIKDWDGKSKLIYVGTGRKTIYELAKQSRPDVGQMSIRDVKVKLPADYA